MKVRQLVLMGVLVVVSMPLRGAEPPAATRRALFLPPPLADEWNRWLVGEWRGAGGSQTGTGKGTVHIEMGLNGQFRIHTERGDIAEISPDQADYLRRNMRATDEEIARFRQLPYRAIELYTIDPATGETVGYLFDSLRCIARGKGRQEGDTETIDWEWTNGHQSTRITRKLGEDRMMAIQRTRMPDGTVLEEKGEAERAKDGAAK